jgi:hypothetical protein
MTGSEPHHQEDDMKTKRWVVGGMIAAVGFAGAAAGYVAIDGSGRDAPALNLVSNDDDKGLRAIGLTADQRLVSFRVSTPGDVRNIGTITGLAGDTKLIGIDYRVQDGTLYGVGDAGGVYTLSSGAKATKVSQLTVALTGTDFGVDFNPAADRLRIVSDTGQNLRHNVNVGGATNTDTMLTYPPATTAAAGVTAVAYTNNDLNADTATALYDIDTAMNQVALQSPANSGQLAPIGKLGADTGAGAGFDIYSKPRGGKAVDAAGYATLSVGGKATLYQVSLITGTAEKVGPFPRASQVVDLALPLNQ